MFELYELIPSNYMRKIIEETGYKLTDSYKATLVWNSDKPLFGRLDALKEIMDSTLDEELKIQISERIDFEENQLSIFKDNSEDKYIYMITYPEIGIVAVTKTFDLAESIVKDADDTCAITIEKTMISKTRDEIVCSTGIVYYTTNGNILKVDNFKDYSADLNYYTRFENQFIDFPYYIPKGTIVKDIRTGQYHVTFTSDIGWISTLRRSKEENIRMDYLDDQITVYTLLDVGFCKSEHINPIYLDLEIDPDDVIRDSKRFTTMTLLGKYFNDETYADVALDSCRSYAQFILPTNDIFNINEIFI